jgi:hypothetical protein
MKEWNNCEEEEWNNDKSWNNNNVISYFMALSEGWQRSSFDKRAVKD